MRWWFHLTAWWPPPSFNNHIQRTWLTSPLSASCLSSPRILPASPSRSIAVSRLLRGNTCQTRLNVRVPVHCYCRQAALHSNRASTVAVQLARSPLPLSVQTLQMACRNALRFCSPGHKVVVEVRHAQVLQAALSLPAAAGKQQQQVGSGWRAAAAWHAPQRGGVQPLADLRGTDRCEVHIGRLHQPTRKSCPAT